MRIEGERQSTNIEDRRGMRMGGPVGIGGGIGTILIVLVISWLTGVNPLALLQLTGGITDEPAQTQVETGAAGEDPQSKFIGAVLGWLTNTACSALAGLLVGAVVVAVMHVLPFGPGKKKHGAAGH